MKDIKNRFFDQNLEGLRGICALVVAFAHVFGYGFFGTMGKPISGAILHLLFARMAVLLFFILSGYVMGISHINTSFCTRNVARYLQKRLIRLYPIYLFALLICAVFGYALVSPVQLFGHVFFLQEFFVTTLPTDAPLWSLSFEFVYYLVFIALWAIHHRSKNWYLVFSIIVICCALIGHDNNCIRSLLIGWVFWLSGLFIARLPESGAESGGASSPLISYFLILLATSDLQSGGFFMRLLHISFNGARQITFNDLVYVPVCSLILLSITRRRFKWLSWLKLLVYSIPALNILALLYFRHDIRADQNWLYGMAFFFIALLFLGFSQNHNLLGKLNGIGRISFAVYVFHFPICYFLNLYLGILMSGALFTLFGMLLAAVVTYGLSYLGEIVVQPKIKRLFLKSQT